MNKPFKPENIVPVLADLGVSISDLKRNPAAVIAAAREQQVAILNRNRPVAYVVAPDVWEYLLDLIEDRKLVALAQAELATPDEEVEVSLDEL
jgi:antitoxin StbD